MLQILKKQEKMIGHKKNKKDKQDTKSNIHSRNTYFSDKVLSQALITSNEEDGVMRSVNKGKQWKMLEQFQNEIISGDANISRQPISYRNRRGGNAFRMVIQQNEDNDENEDNEEDNEDENEIKSKKKRNNRR